jgi:NodT family efflux transporter outer membrane factor (OMF) lipoprotein
MNEHIFATCRHAAGLVQSLAVGSLLAACAVAGPNFVPPAAPALGSYTPADPNRADAGDAEASQSITSGTVSEAWWRAFGSAALDRIVDLALANSPTLESAKANLAQAGEAVSAAKGGRYPQIGIDAGIGRGSQSGARTAAGAVNDSTVGPTLTYGLDAFGATSRRIEQAEALADYQRAQSLASTLAVTSTVVQQVIDLASAIEQAHALQDIIAADRRNLELVQVSVAAGKSAGLDALTAESQAASDRALLPPLLQQAGAARHALAVLVGKASAEWSAPDFDFDTLAMPRDLPLSLPSELVHRRPDIQAAEAQLHAASAGIGIASAQLYPSITVNASWTAAATGGALFANPSSVWDVAVGLVAPVFNGGTLRAQRAAAVDAYAAQLGTYRQTVLQAFSQVADVLDSLGNDASLLAAQRKALDVAQATLELSQQSFQAGQISFLQIIEVQRLYQQARLGYVRAKAQRYADSLQLFVAMGGAMPVAPAVPPN